MDQEISPFSIGVKNSNGAMSSLTVDSGGRLLMTIAAEIAPLSSRYYIASTAEATVNGFFTDANGVAVGDAFTTTIATAVAKSWADIYGAALPVGAVGVIIDSTQDLKYWISTAPSATAITYTQTNKAKLPTLALGKNISIGAIA